MTVARLVIVARPFWPPVRVRPRSARPRGSNSSITLPELSAVRRPIGQIQLTNEVAPKEEEEEEMKTGQADGRTDVQINTDRSTSCDDGDAVRPLVTCSRGILPLEEPTTQSRKGTESTMGG